MEEAQGHASTNQASLPPWPPHVCWSDLGFSLFPLVGSLLPGGEDGPSRSTPDPSTSAHSSETSGKVLTIGPGTFARSGAMPWGREWLL